MLLCVRHLCITMLLGFDIEARGTGALFARLHVCVVACGRVMIAGAIMSGAGPGIWWAQI